MRTGLLAAAAIVVATVAAASVAAAPAQQASAQRKAPAARDWSRTVVRTPEGGFRMGNPAAQAKLIEYGSLTCPHCASFAKEGFPILVRDYVKSGKLSFEYRNHVRNAYDMAGSLLTNCASPARFFPLTESLYATQGQWLPRFKAITPEQSAALDALPVPAQLVRYAAIGGFDTMAVKAGIPAAKARQCLTDQKSIDRQVAMGKTAHDVHGIHGTPSFILNGQTTHAHSWTDLEPLVRAAGG